MAIIQGSINVQTSFQQPLASLPGAPAVAAPQRLTCGFGSTGVAGALEQADLKHTKTYNFAGAAQSLDLTAAVDAFGTVNFARIRSITIRVYTTTDGQILTLGAAGSNPWTAIFSGTYIIQASSTNCQGLWVQTAPNATGYLVSGTSKILKMDPGANTFSADVEILGCSA